MSHWGSIFASNVFYVILFLPLFSISINDYYYHKEFKIKCTNRFQIINYNDPLNDTIKSIIYGSLLGDAHAEKRKEGKGTRITFYQEAHHSEYLLYLHFLIASLGYCNTNTPKITTRLGSKGKIKSIIRFSTWTYESFNEIHKEWYINKKKIIPRTLDKYLTPLALAIWIQDDGGKVSSGLKLATNSFSLKDCEYLADLLNQKYNLKASVQSAGVKNQYIIYISKYSIPLLNDIISPYVVNSMKYKITY